MDAAAEELRAQIKAEIDSAIAEAWNAADPDPSTLETARVPRGRRRVTGKNVVTAIRDALHDEMAADDRVVLLGEDMGNRGGVFGVTRAGWTSSARSA